MKQKLYEEVNKIIFDFCKHRYNLEPSENSMSGYSMTIVNNLLQKINIKPEDRSNQIRKLAARWMSTNKIRGNLNGHSVGGFCDYLSEKYYVIMFDKFEITSKIKYKIIKWLLK